MSTFGGTYSAKLDCKYDYYEWKGVGNIYYCWIQNSLGISSPESAQIDSETGSHESGKNNNAVKGIWSDKGGISYFPRGLQRLYPNIVYIYIKKGYIKEIHQSDLKQYPNLAVLDIAENDIEVLEDGLFTYNPDLVHVSFTGNKICYVEPNIFDHLTKLRWLYFDKNECINQIADNSLTAVEGLIKTINNNVCVCPDYVNQKLKFEILLLEFNILGYEEFKKKLELFENEFKRSKYAHFASFLNQLQSIKASLEERYQQIISVGPTGINQYETCAALKSKLVQSAITMNDLLNQGSFGAEVFLQTCDPLFDGKLETIAGNLNEVIDALGIVY